MVVKWRLLLRTLEQVPDSERHALLIQAADTAAAQAATTPYPGLVFPCLFEERVAEALELDERRKRFYWAVANLEEALVEAR